MSYDGQRFGPVIGIVEDFHYSSMHNPVEPLILVHTSRVINKISIKLSSEDMVGSIASIQQIWKNHAPKSPINYSFLDENYESLYDNESKMSTLFSWSSVLAILIACLGLYGLALFSSERRTKEIGVRKILGASVNQIIGLLAREYILIIGLAMLISIPLSFIIADQWLENFAFRIQITWWIFLLAGFLSLAVAFITVSFQSLKAAFTKPVDSLNRE